MADQGGERQRQQQQLVNLNKATKEEEHVEREMDVNSTSQLCGEHGRGISAADGVERGKTVACEVVDDGSGQLAEKCESINQQADHFRCHS